MAEPLLSMVHSCSNESSVGRKITIFSGFSPLGARKKATASYPSPLRSVIWTDWIFRPLEGETYS